MKIKQKIFIFILLIIFLSASNVFTFEVFTQDQNNEFTAKTVPRTVLVELFVQGECITCPTAEFCLEDLAYEYGTTKFILVQEHLWGDGYDTPETNARYNWYVGDDKKGTPDVFIDGLTKRLYGLACECVEENYECYKNAIDEELVQPSLLEISASKTPHPDPFPQGEKEEGEESPQGVEEAKGEDKEGELIEEKLANIIIEGTVKNVSDTTLEDLAVCGMVGKEGDEPGLYNYIQDIFSFQNMPPLLPGATFNFKFISEIEPAPESETEDEKDEKGEEEVLHLVVFVQNLKTKEILQSLYVE